MSPEEKADKEPSWIHSHQWVEPDLAMLTLNNLRMASARQLTEVLQVLWNESHIDRFLHIYKFSAGKLFSKKY